MSAASTLFYDPHPSLMADASALSRLRATPWVRNAVRPFSRLVHVRRYPVRHLGCPYICDPRRRPLPSRAGATN